MFTFLWLWGTPLSTYAQTNTSSIISGKIIHAGTVKNSTLEGFDIGTFTQDLRIAIVEGNAYKEIDMINDFTPLTTGDRVFIRATPDDGEVFYSIYDLDRRYVLFILCTLFIFAVIVFGGKRGLRSLLSLILSIAMIFFVLMPLVTAGHSPVLWGVIIALVLLATVMSVTHGFTKKTLAAFLGTGIAVIITGGLAFVTVHFAKFTGIGDEEAFALMVSGAPINLSKLLLAGIIIGMIGVLDDVAITQASVVMELKRAGVHGRELFARAMHVGREHVGALINTLILAYAGASLPLFLLLATYNEPLGALLSIEIVATEIVRSLLGSIGIILAVPLTTFLATLLHDDGTTNTHHH